MLESLAQYLSIGNVFLAVLLLFFLHQLAELYSFRGMPPGPRFPFVPVLGHVLSFDFKADNFADATRSFRSGYGRVYSFKLGKFKIVVAGNAAAAKEVLVTRSGDFAGRPQTYGNVASTLGGKDIVLGNYGPAWRLHRKLFTTALRQYLSNVPLIEERISREAGSLLRYMEEQNSRAFDPADILARSVANVICRITFGEEYDTSDVDMKELLRLNQQVLSSAEDLRAVGVLDFFPLVEYLPIPAYRRLLDLQFALFDIIRKHLHKSRKRFDPGEQVRDLMSGLIHAQNDEEGQAALLTDDHLVNTVEDMFAAGYETTSTTLKWAIAYLANYPRFQSAIQRQLDDVIGPDRVPCLEDRPNLPLVHATIMEVLRCGNIVPQAIPHLTLKDTELCGYHVPKDAVVLVDLEAVHLDPNCWENASVFDPHRHLDSDGKLVTNQGNFYPFSAGRRVCAGEPLAKLELFLFLSWMLQKFNFVPEEGMEPPELIGVVGATQSPKPYKIRAIKR